MKKTVNEVIFVSPFDGLKQSYLIKKPKSSIYHGIAICLHGATNHQCQGMDRNIFNGTFGHIQDYFEKNNYVYVCPEYRGDSWMNNAAESDIFYLINRLKSEFKTGNVILMGGSMGGTSALIFSTRHPDIVSGVFAMCPATDMEKLYYQWIFGNQKHLAYGIEIAYGGTPEHKKIEYAKRSSIKHIKKLKNKPVAIIHGNSDNLISVEHSRSFVKKAEKTGIKIFYQEIEHGDHDSPVKQFSFIEKALLWIEKGISFCAD